jgi:predicted TPR repeat methyltransferase
LTDAINLMPGAIELRFELSAIGGDRTVETVPASYVAWIFDNYASWFESHVVGVLHYRAPQLLLDAIAAARPNRTFDVLDLGCGTGLCGAALRQAGLAKRLDGVDLSPGMIEQCRTRGIYDELTIGDLREALRSGRKYELLLAGDVFIYVGALEEVMAAAGTALEQGGLLAFTVEACAGESYELHPTGRFAHSLAYLLNVARPAGFEQESAGECVLRTEGNKPVAGWVVVLRKA